MSDRYDIRKVQPSDAESLTSLYADVFKVDFPPSYWRWKYFDNPHGDNMMYVAVSGDQIVGQVGTIPVHIKCGDETHLSSQTCDIVVRPEYQKGGPFIKLYRRSNEENVDRRSLICYGYSVPTTLKISSKLLKFRPVCPVWRWVLVLDPTSYVAEKLRIKPLARFLGWFGMQYIRLRLGRHRKTGAQDMEAIHRFDERFDRFWEERKNDDGIMIARTARYLNWRYMDHPLANYAVYARTRDDRVEGFVVLTVVQEHGLRRAFILELMTAPDDRETVNALLAATMEHVFRERADNLTLWMPEHDARVDFVEGWGFAKRETPHHLIAKIFLKDREHLLDYVLDPRNWFFSMGDSDYH